MLDICILFLLQMTNLQNSMILEAAGSLDFRTDTIGSINMLLCGKQNDHNSTNMTFSLPSSGRTADDEPNSIMSNSSGKC